MPGILTNLGAGHIVSEPGNFTPMDSSVWEWIVDDYAPDEDTFQADRSTAFLSGYLKDPDLLFDALVWFVGMSELMGGSVTGKVQRWTPAVHPRWPFMRCVDVSVKGEEFDGETRTISNFPNLKKMPRPDYVRYRFDIKYETLDFDYKEDEEVDSEWERCLTIDPSDEGEIVTVDGGQYLYNAPSKASLNAKPVVINGPMLKVYTQRAGLLVKSYNLPAHFIMDEYGIAPKFLAAKGKVNSATFLNKPRGTMLLQNYRFHKKAQPVATKNAGQLLFGLTVEMLFGFTDPGRAEPTETRRGWQLVPAVSGTGTGWYGIYNKENTSEDLYPYYDMNDLLTLHSS